MTAVTWLLEELKKVHHPTEAMIMYAKKLEKQQMIDAYWGGLNGSINDYSESKQVGSEIIDIKYGKGADQYYNETYGSKGSDGHELDDDIPPTSQYFPTSSQTEISDESWEGCDGCTEQDKYFWTKGYQAGYNRATPTEISDDRTKLHWKTSLVVHTPEISDEEIEKAAETFWPKANESSLIRCWILGAKWYREQLKLKI